MRLKNVQGRLKEVIMFFFLSIIAAGLMYFNLPLGKLVGDVKIFYIPAGKYYVNGGDPSNLNWEHPPLAKYLIGLSIEYLGSVFYVSLLVVFLGLLYFWFLLRGVTGNPVLSLLVVLSMCLDGVFLEVSTSGILDVFMVSFSVPALYYTMKYVFVDGKDKYLIVAGIFSGLSIACKWSLIPLVLIMLTFSMYVMFNRMGVSRRSMLKVIFREMTFIAVIFIVYCASYLVFFLHGHSIFDLIVLHARMVNFHRTLNSPTLWTSMNGLLKLLFNLSVFKTYFCENIMKSTSIVNGTPVVYYVPVGAEYRGLHIYMYSGLGGLGRVVFLPAVIYLIYLILKNKTLRFEGTFFLAVALSATAICLSSNLDWYTYDSMWYWYLLFGYVASKVDSRKRKIMTSALLLLNLLSFILLKLGYMVFDLYV